MNSMHKAKKRLMFIQKEDYNFLAYNLILLLDMLECYSEDKSFRDFRKIAYLIDFISSSKDISDYTQTDLESIYSKAQLKKKLLSHLLIVLKNKKFLDISLNNTHKSFNIWLKKENIPKEFLNYQYFTNEVNKINSIKKEIRSLSRTTIKTLVENLFANKGIMTWEI